MVRVLTVLKEYINECDSDYHEERTILPMSRYSHYDIVLNLSLLITVHHIHTRAVSFSKNQVRPHFK